MTITEITRADVAKFHHDLRRIPYQTNRCLEEISEMFSLSEMRGLRPDGTNLRKHIRIGPPLASKMFPQSWLAVRLRQSRLAVRVHPLFPLPFSPYTSVIPTAAMRSFWPPVSRSMFCTGPTSPLSPLRDAWHQWES